ncbi:hypothetical protein EJ110_NYTH33201 [Nymphaea thermarum]|nr:hypothetical protein EJ110_NYTH33201 [Nymphaea thermarum]
MPRPRRGRAWPPGMSITAFSKENVEPILIVQLLLLGMEPKTIEIIGIVKKSLGDDWGEGGYIRMQKNIAETLAGLFGITIRPSYPIKI